MMHSIPNFLKTNKKTTTTESGTLKSLALKNGAALEQLVN